MKWKDKGDPIMKICKDCVFLNKGGNGNCVCSLRKLSKPFEPGFYLKNPREKACEQLKERKEK